jgi:hypothetical protein
LDVLGFFSKFYAAARLADLEVSISFVAARLLNSVDCLISTTSRTPSDGRNTQRVDSDFSRSFLPTAVVVVAALDAIKIFELN